jgi:hypothetical protein
MLRARVENPIRFPSPEPNYTVVSNPQSHRHRIGTIPLPAPIGFGGTVACIVYAPAARLAPELTSAIAALKSKELRSISSSVGQGKLKQRSR